MLRAISALELIQACALIHDDLMDASATRRGRPTVHVAFARRHADAGWHGRPARFGAAAAILLGDLALVWADDMLRAAGLAAAALVAGRARRGRRCAPRCSAASTSTCCTRPPATRTARAALQIDRYKTAAYTVERPLHLGAAIAGAGPELVGGVPPVRRRHRRRLPAPRRPARRVRRPRGHRQARGRRPARGQADAAARRRDWSARGAGRRDGRAGGDRRPRSATPTSTRRGVDRIRGAAHRARRRAGRRAADRRAHRLPRWTRWPPRHRRAGGIAAGRAGGRRHHGRTPVDAHGRGPHRPRRGRRRRAVRAVRRPAPARRGPAGDGRRAGGAPRRPGRPARPAHRARHVPGRHRPDRADHARPARRGVRRGRARSSPSGSTWSSSTRPTARTSPTAPPSTSTPTPTRWRPRSGGSAGRTPPTATGGCGSGSPRSTAPRSTRSSAPTSTRRSTCSAPTWCGWPRLGGFGRLGPRVARFLPDERLQRIFSFQALYAGRAAANGARRVRRDRLHGHRGGRVLPARRDAAGRAGAGRRGRRRRGRDPLRPHGHRARSGATVGSPPCGTARSPTAPRERAACDAVVLTPDLPVVDRLVGRAPRRVVPLRWSPSAVVLHAGLRAAPARARAPHDLLRRGVARTFREIIDDGRLMSDPSLLVTRPDRDRPDARARRAPTCCSCSPPARTSNAARSTGRASARAYRDELLARARRRAGTPGSTDIAATSRSRGWSRRPTGRPTDSPRAPRSRRPTRSPRPVRSGRATSCAGWTTSCWPGCGTTPGVGIPPVLISGRLAAQRITGAGRAGAQGHPAGVSRRVRAWIAS